MERRVALIRRARLLATATLCLGSVQAMAQGAPLAATATAAASAYGPWGFNLKGQDLSVVPGDNFFERANGTYVRDLVIPSDHSSWGAFNILAELSRDRTRAILEELAKTPSQEPTTIGQKLGAFYATYLDAATVERKGAGPLAPDLDQITKVVDRSQFAHLLGTAQRNFQSSLYGMVIAPDPKDPTVYSVQLAQSGLGLPDRDYYLKPEFAEKKAAYQSYVGQMLDLIGWPESQLQAEAVVNFETAIARKSWTRAESRDPDKTYNPMSVDDVVRAAPGFDWHAYLAGADLGSTTNVVLGEKSAIIDEAAIAAGTDLATLRAWLAFHLVDNAAALLPKRFVDAHFAFAGKTLTGQPENLPREKLAATATSSAMGMALGEIYVGKYFTPADRATVRSLTDDLKAVFRIRLAHNGWMSEPTKQEALKKLDMFAVQIGYPNKWRDYSGLVVHPGDLYGNSERSVGFEWSYWLGHLGKSVDRDEWDMTPQTVNAYNNPPFDEVVFPAAILQPPFFNRAADPAINYGAIGGVIGHEMTHSFDDQGRKYDETGKLRDWWTAEDAKRFDARAARLGAQFSAMEPFPGLHINGQLTMGENIADLGGLTLGLDAYHASLHGHPAPVIDGLSGDQRVFLGWAQVWRAKLRDDAAKQRLVSDPHSPPMARVNGPMRNIDAWYAAWHVEPGEAMYLAPADRVQIW